MKSNVLDHGTIVRDVATISPNPFGAVAGSLWRIFLVGVHITIHGDRCIFSLRCLRVFQWVFDPFLMRFEKYAAPTARITLGICIITCGTTQDLFGPELPFLVL